MEADTVQFVSDRFLAKPMHQSLDHILFVIADITGDGRTEAGPDGLQLLIVTQSIAAGESMLIMIEVYDGINIPLGHPAATGIFLVCRFNRVGASCQKHG